MKNNQKIKISYEPDADVLSYEINHQTIDHAQEIGNIIVHFTKDDSPVLVEILEATQFLNQAVDLKKKIVTQA